MIKRLPDNCLSLYADLLQKTIASQHAILSGGSFVSKNIQGSVYWYYQTKIGGVARQKYLGRESEYLLKDIEQAKAQRHSLKDILSERQRLVAMLGVGGATLEKGRPAKILASMADAGLFTSGGVLVGSFAYSCYGNMLGVVMNEALSRTSDMDFSVERKMEIGVKRAMLDEIKLVDPAFKATHQFSPSMPPFDLVAPDGFKVEFLTTKEHAADRTPIMIERFMLHAQPLEFMDYLIEDAQSAVILSGAGVPVVVPSPGRFALHKLAVSQLRPISFQAKVTKDIAQAASIIEILLEDNPGALLLAVDALKQRKDLLVKHISKGVELLPEEVRKSLCDRVEIPDIEWDAKTGVARIGV
ncbi:MAG: GSU2403 family nucleotidyltransferase fold protein [Gallionella sp.]|nr:GSU2403 family nucleotidyltransferase fold protein [Gallionella sp.]MDP1594614.1 GSU2403 family nucleotidyltransferase fold protein [Gallionella sp.]